MERIPDLVLDAYNMMGLFSKYEGSESIAEKLLSMHPDASESEIDNSIADALKVARAVNSMPLSFYYEPYTKIHDLIQEYIRNSVPGLSNDVYRLAERRMMFIYIK